MIVQLENGRQETLSRDKRVSDVDLELHAIVRHAASDKCSVDS